MQSSHETVSLALTIKDAHPDLEAPVNDVAECIDELRQTGLGTDEIQTLVPNMFLCEDTNGYTNGERQPACDEILVYDVPDELQELVTDPA